MIFAKALDIAAIKKYLNKTLFLSLVFNVSYRKNYITG